MDAVINTVMTGLITAGHAAVGRVDDGSAFERRDISPPEIDSLPHRGQFRQPGNLLCFQFSLQIGILPFSLLICCKYSSCTRKNSSSIAPGILIFIRDRSSLFCSSTLAGICIRVYFRRSFNNVSIRYTRFSFWFISLSSFNGFYRTVFITVSAVQAMLLPDPKGITFLYTSLRTYFSAGSAADAAFGYEISFFFQFFYQFI